MSFGDGLAMIAVSETAPMAHDSVQRGRSLEYLTIGWNLFEAAGGP